MPVTGLYFIPANQNSPTATKAVIERLRDAYNPTFCGRWALEHRLLRDTPSCLPPSDYAPLPPLQPRFMQFLSLSHRQPYGFIYISDRPDPDPWDSTSSSAKHAGHAQQQQQQQYQQTPQQHQQSQQNPTPQAPDPSPSGPKTMMILDYPSYQSFHAITLRACEPLWCPRHTLTVLNGSHYEINDFRIRIGDVRQTAPQTRVRGTIVEIEYRGPAGTATPHTAAATATATAPGADNNIPMADGSETWPSSVADGNVNPDGSRDDEGILYPQLETSMSTLSSSSLSLPTSSSSFSFSSPSSVEEIPTEEDWEVAEVLIRELWSRFAVEGAREVIRVPHLGKEAREARRLGKLGDRETNARIAGADLAKQYMEVFRFNR
ncbi:Med20 superfamily domain-containing protein [Histoplasma capsulatum]|uniref:Mediator of RNA polymerase II transcription subunit 20 n=1 Tax=Ajellomyces capsulatus TaxID=5037 RepID=A0A8A1LZ25_AJECA|nr:predicted protein [Histoplasma mississippiense (nom. inval.)]EDN03459.1 predicted protein [Histoplasma mississippiense (nom. inval.)]QSS59129.1 Med20 superfamily domain-containing protein [Histoplasma capsulatum]